jgi:hypothetical protein
VPDSVDTVRAKAGEKTHKTNRNPQNQQKSAKPTEIRKTNRNPQNQQKSAKPTEIRKTNSFGLPKIHTMAVVACQL